MTPIFIGGCPRSGTTVLGAVLGMNDRCITIPEAKFKTNLFHTYALEQDNFSSDRFIADLQKQSKFRIWNMDISLASDKAPQLDKSPAELMKYIVQQYGNKLGKTKTDFWVDHTPSNLVQATTLLNFFPSAKMIHIIRDGRATAASVMPLDWGPNIITKAAHWWAENIAYGLSYESCLDKNQITRVRYEDLISQPEKTVKTLCNFLCLDYQPKMLTAAGFELPSYTLQQHKLIGKNLNMSRISAWEKELTQREIEIFENLTGDLLTSFCYSLKYGNTATRMSPQELRHLALQDNVRKIINKYRKKRRTKRAV